MPTIRHYVRVPIDQGEAIRKQLLAAGLLDTGYKIRTENKYLLIPLSHEMASTKLQTLLKTEVELGVSEFDSHISGPRTLAEALDGVMTPEQIELIPRAYDLVGEIAVLEIPKELNHFKYEIGRAFHKIHPNFTTVLAKLGAISGLKRVRDYEVISGPPKTDTIHTEYNCRIAVDLARAYFSPRLLEEHHRVAELVNEDEVVLDMFTGVGPFALHIARTKHVRVIAVDINPDAIALLHKSLTLNHLIGVIEPVVADARYYIRNKLNSKVDRVIMNHPSGASTFISEACLAVKPGGIIHYYDFIGGTDPEQILSEKVEQLVNASGHTISQIDTIRRVRDSAPYEYQMVIDMIIE